MLFGVALIERGIGCLDGQLAVMGHSIARVDREVEDHGLHLARVDEAIPQTALDDRLDLDCFAQSPSQHVVHAVQQPPNVLRFRFQRLLTAESQQLRCQVGTARDAGDRVLGEPTLRIITGHVLQEQLQIAPDHLQQVVEIMRDASRQLTHGLDFLGLDQAGLQAIPLGHGLIHAVLQSVAEFLLGVACSQLIRDVAHFDDGANGLSRLILHRRCGEADRVEASILVNEGLLALDLMALGESAIDLTFLDRERSPVRVRVVDHIVERPSLCLRKSVACQGLRGLVHEHALLVLIHHENRHGRVAQDRVEPRRRFRQCGSCCLLLRDVLDRRVEDAFSICRNQLKMHPDVIASAVFALMDRLEFPLRALSLEQGFSQRDELLFGDFRLEVPRCLVAELLHGETEVVPRALVDQGEPEVVDGEDVDLAHSVFDDATQLVARHAFNVPHYNPRIS
mmetsp:Transcript_4209/g.7600  ORF Transcript_4209/g.7600 Transcript_4209/m.7600 type:complete len:452 (-) Transcript_4209:48-1403(-)